MLYGFSGPVLKFSREAEPTGGTITDIYKRKFNWRIGSGDNGGQEVYGLLSAS
jgi:hypothetical protein